MSNRDNGLYLLRMGDTCLILGHRMSELMGHAPILEEDLAIANIALELVDQARAWFTLAGTLEGKGRDEDRLAYHRAEHEYLNARLAEQPNGHFGDTVARALLLSAWQRAWYRNASLTASDDVRALAQRFLPQSEFHWRWASAWTSRLGDGTPLSHNRIQSAIDTLWKFTGELVTADETDAKAASTGFGPDTAAVAKEWDSAIDEALSTATLTRPTTDTLRWHGKRGQHGEDLGLLLAEMQSLPRAHPGAQW